MTTTHENHRSPGSTSTRRAWWSIAGFAPSFVLAFLIGEGLIAALGYPSGGATQAPWWAVVVAGVPALAVFVLPAVVAVRLGRRALAQGDPNGWPPVIVALAIAGSILLLNGASALLILLT